MRAKSRRGWGVAALAVAALVLGGCAQGRGVSRAVASRVGSAVVAPATPATPAVVPATLKFTSTTLDGKPFDAASLAGKPVILWFWAPWCAVCFGEGPAVNSLAEQYKGRVSLVGVAGLEQSNKAMKEFVSQADVGGVTHLDDRTGAVWKKFGIKEQSNFVMINRTGEVMLTGWQDTVTLAQWAAYLDQH